MPVILEKDDPGVFRFVTNANLLRQIDFLKLSVEKAKTIHKAIVCREVVCELNRLAVDLLCEHPGQYRKGPIGIQNSRHVPPPHEFVEDYMADFFDYLEKNWDVRDAMHLAAFALWRICWIHPFEEGNGRTARAACYLVLCAKLGFWLPGTNTIFSQIRADNRSYYDSLSPADEDVRKPVYAGSPVEKDGPYKAGPGLDRTSAYLTRLLTVQLSE